MAKFLTEDEVRDTDKSILGFDQVEEGIQQGTGQITTFNQLGIKGKIKPESLTVGICQTTRTQ